MRFSVDLAIVDGQAEAIETLTGAAFSVLPVDCEWWGPRSCVSTADGKLAGNWLPVESPQAFFGLQAPSARHSYLVDVLAVRSDSYDWRTGGPHWKMLAPALKSFVAGIGGNDRIGVTSVQLENGVASTTVLGPFTSDGSIYFDAIDQLAQPAGHDWPPILESLTESIVRAADARDAASSNVEPTVLVLGQPTMSLAEIYQVTTLAQQLGVHVSTVEYATTWGVQEMAMRTGGFEAWVADTRQFSIVFGAMDRLLAGTMPFYRMEFELTGGKGTFVAGGNAKVRLHIDVPTSLPTLGLIVDADVAIP